MKSSSAIETADADPADIITADGDVRDDARESVTARGPVFQALVDALARKNELLKSKDRTIAELRRRIGDARGLLDD